MGQIGVAVQQMDQATQQNAALVEQSAAAAESLKGQAEQLVQAVAVFKLVQGGERFVAAPKIAVAPRPAVKSFPSAERRGPQRSRNVARLAPKGAPEAPELTTQAATRKTGTDDEWTSF